MQKENEKINVPLTLVHLMAVNSDQN